MKASQSGRERKAGMPPERRRALDPFFIFTYTLLALAVAIQFFLMGWMDVL